MRSSTINGTAQGALLGVIAFVLISSSFPLTAVAATTTSGPLFNMTLIAPTTNPARRQWASIITSSLDSVNIGANLVFVSFTVLLNDFFGCPTGCPTKSYADGGFDAGFVGFNVLTALPDYGTQSVAAYRDTGAGDVPPIGSNYYFFDNATYNNLANQYDGTFTQAGRIPIIQQMAAIIAQERPAMVLFYPESVYAYPTYLKSWSTNVVNPGNVASDYTHWKSSSGSSLNVAEPGDIAAINLLPTSAQNSFYMTYLSSNTQSCGECLDARTNIFYDGTVAAITSSADHLTWTVREIPHTFSDGVSVTANDYIYAQMATLVSNVGYVGEGSAQSVLGLSSSFTFLNGTSDYVFNGTYAHGSSSTLTGYNITAGSTFKAINSTTWQFTLPAPYVFTDPVYTSIGPIPIHLYDQYAFNTWSSGVLSGFTSGTGGLSTGPFTYHYNTVTYGGNGGDTTLKVGNGTGQSWGPLSDGPYIYHGYDPVANVGTMIRNDNFWNASALQANGYDKITTIHVVYISGKDAAVAALSSGEVNLLDANYQFNAQDVASFQSSGMSVYEASGPTAGWQEMGLNLGSPIWGTGTATPNGAKDPANAHKYALDVREAISYLIPRQYIVQSLLGGLGTTGIEQFSPAFSYIYAPSTWSPNGVAADPYNPTAAKSFLAAAGYQTGVPPPSVSTGGVAPFTVSGVTVPGFLLGNTMTLSGTFPVDPVLGAQSNGFVVTLQQYTSSASCPQSNFTCWTSVALGATNTGGAFAIPYVPTATGNVTYRAFFTGIPQSVATRAGWTTARQAESEVPPLCTSSGCIEGAPLNKTDTLYSQTTTLNIGSLSNVINALVTNINNGFSSTAQSINSLQANSASKSDLSALTASVNSLSSQVTNLNNSLNTTTDIAYAAVAVAIILGLIAIALSRRKPS
jgi:ABC-type transport system substrate-binding protein